MSKGAIVLFSGGMDSTVCLLKAMKDHRKVIALTFHYGQRHWKEISCARIVCKKLRVKNVLLSLPTWCSSRVALVSPRLSILGRNSRGLQKAFVPCRNVLFLTYAASMAYEQGWHYVYSGVCELGTGVYPDCRGNVISKLGTVLTKALKWNITLLTPLLKTSKECAIYMGNQMASDFGLDGNFWGLTYSCLHGGNSPCKRCSACRLRRAGFRAARLKDPLVDNN